MVDGNETDAGTPPMRVSVSAFSEGPTPESPSIQLTEWLEDAPSRDPGLLGAFAFTMRRRGRNAAPRAVFDTAFTAFAAETPE